MYVCLCVCECVCVYMCKARKLGMNQESGEPEKTIRN